MIRSPVVILSLSIFGVIFAIRAEAQPKPIFHVPFEDSPHAVIARGEGKTIGGGIDAYEPGVVGKAARSDRRYNGIRWDGRGNVDLDRGTIALFYKPNGEVTESEWETRVGIWSDIDGYWGNVLGFHQIDDTFSLQIFDVGRYTRRVKFHKIVGRWKKEQWVHLAAVWDRNEGIKVYEDGQLVDSNWGEYRWAWNLDPRVLHVGGSIYATTPFSADELYVFGECLTDAQVAQLAKGQAPAGEPTAITPSDQRRPADLARMGWLDEDLQQIPVATPGQPLRYTFARVERAVDAKRLIAQPFEGLRASCWPLSKYGASVSGKLLELYLAPDQQFDRVRMFAQRATRGRFAQLDPVTGLKPVIEVDAARPFWRAKFDAPRRDPAIYFQRDHGIIGQIDLFRVEPQTEPLKDKLTIYTTAAKIESIEPTEAGKALMGDTPCRFQNAVRATAQRGAASTLDSPAMGGVQILTEPLTESIALRGVVVNLVTGRLTKPTAVQIVVKEPVWAQRDWLVADAVLQPGNNDREQYTFVLTGRPVVTPVPGFSITKHNNTITQPAMELGVLVTASEPVTWHTGSGGTSVALMHGEMDPLKPIAVADAVEFAREAFAESMEGHIWDGHPMEMWGRLAYPVLYLMGVAPDDRQVLQLATRLGWRTEPLPIDEPKNVAGAPPWAFWQMQALKENKRILHWIIDNRQIWNGEFGGVFGDDTDMVENWFDFALMGDDDHKIRDSLRRICDGLWKYNLVDGVSASIRDALHSYEEGMGTISMQLLMDYGDPVAVERTMTACSHYDKWMKRNDDGSYSFRGWYWGASGVWDHGDFARDIGTNGLAFVPAAYLIWYNHHPAPQPFIMNWKLALEGNSIVRDTVYELLSQAERETFRKNHYATQLESLMKQGSYAMTANAIVDEIGLRDDQKEAYTTFGRYAKVPETSQMALHMTEAYASLYKATGDIEQLIKSYKDTCVLINNLDWTYTVAQPSTDRIPPPHSTLSRARLGAIAMNRAGNGSFWPRHGLSYSRGGDDVAALVTENSYTGLSARLWSFPETEHTLQLRVWRLWPGEYTVALYEDKNDDGVVEGSIHQTQQTLQRGSFIDFKLPPRRGLILSIKAVKAAPPSFDKPDPAISAGDVAIEYASGHLHVLVHNIGVKPAENIVVRVTDAASGAVVAEQKIDRIDAPLDLKPRTRRVEFHNVDCMTNGVIVELNPDAKVDDLNPFNNRVEYRY